MTRKRFARPVREKSIEDKCRAIAEAHGGRLIKTAAIGWPGFPDRMALFPKHRRSFYVEFKRGDEQPTDLQFEWHSILRLSAQIVYVVRSVEEFKGLIAMNGID